MTYDLSKRAQELYEGREMQQKWLDAIKYLREKSVNGWLLDTEIKRK